MLHHKLSKICFGAIHSFIPQRVKVPVMCQRQYDRQWKYGGNVASIYPLGISVRGNGLGAKTSRWINNHLNSCAQPGMREPMPFQGGLQDIFIFNFISITSFI